MPSTPAARQARREMREWVKDENRPLGGYWFAGHLPDEKHGDVSTYNNWFCRCDPCTEDNTKAKLRRRAERWGERVFIPAEGETEGYWYAPNAPKHGKSSTFRNWGCHCPPCFEAEKEEIRKFQGRESQHDQAQG